MDLELEENSLERAVREDGRYPSQAYEFLQAGLVYATERRYAGQPAGQRRHVTGQELAESLRDLALKRWGALAREVLRHWNIHRTRDFGEMVYLLIREGAMGKQDSDDITDFDDVYDFRRAFDGYQIDFPRTSDEDAAA